ncbi:fimbrial biogenesis chaperone [Yersinia intermedia]|uniref:fimbria/pilus periplasmic chaperone n=1 Tax=Yersinia intermedia TaxID=631 RepID=UPI0005DDD27E|nr:fimbria/pilus periplasmic chaperone [Yersinia intermedia]CNI62685.1 alpha-related fimbriae chaperone 1 [Yersinia intermedia]
MKYTYLFFTLAFLLAPISTTYAQLVAVPTRTTVEALDQHKAIQVYNNGDKPLYLEITLQRVDNPGVNPEQKTLISDISRPEMIFNPNRITLGPKQKRNIKLLPLKSPTQETLYRLYINPVVDIKAIGSHEDKNKIHAPMTISIGYGVLIHHVPPLTAQVRRWQHKCLSSGHLMLTSTGTVHSKFEQLNSCDKTDSLNLYPGTPITLSTKQLSGKVDNETFTVHCD